MKTPGLALFLALAAPVASLAQEPIVLTGVVTTKDDGLSLPGATVAIEALSSPPPPTPRTATR